LATLMAHWLEVPEVEAFVQAAGERPLSLDVLHECVEAIAAAVNRHVKRQGDPPVVTYRNHKGAFYNVSVRDGEYWIFYEHAVAQLEFSADRTEELAWKICGYKCTPAEMRMARARAERDGFTGKILPNEYFLADSKARK
jgi:hypothetical protein